MDAMLIIKVAALAVTTRFLDAHPVANPSETPLSYLEDAFNLTSPASDFTIDSTGQTGSSEEATNGIISTTAMTEVFADEQKPLISRLSPAVEASVGEDPAWNGQARALLSIIRPLPRWHFACVVCVHGEPGKEPGQAHWCSRMLSGPWLAELGRVIVVLHLDLPIQFQGTLGLSSWKRKPLLEKGFFCDFAVMLMERPRDALSLQMSHSELWAPTMSHIVVFLEDMATTPGPGVTGVDDAMNPDPAQVLLLLWRQRFVHRALLFPTAQCQLLAYDGPGRRVLYLSASSARDAEEARAVLISHLKDLQGIAVTVVMFDRNFTAYRVSRNPPEFGGMDAWVLNIFAKHLNFTPVVIETSDGRQYGYHYDNGTFTGTYADMVEGRAALAFNGHFVLDYNTRAVTPSSSVDFDALCILAPAAGRLPTYEALWHALGPTLLLGFICASSAMVLLFNWLKSHRPPGEQRFRPCYVSVVLFGAPASTLPTASWQRIFIGTCALFSVLYVTLFQATVATAIFHPGSYPEIDTLEELDKRGLHMYTASDSLASTTFSDDNIIQKRLGKKVHVLLVEDNWNEIFQHGTAASMTRHSSYVPKPKQHLVKECPRQYFISYMVPYGSPLLKSLNMVINRLHAGGILGLLLKHSVDPSANGTTYQKSTDNNQAFNLEDLLGAFMFLLAGLTFSLIVFLWETLLHGRFRRGEAEPQDRCVDIDTELYRQWWQRQGGNKEAVQGGNKEAVQGGESP